MGLTPLDTMQVVYFQCFAALLETFSPSEIRPSSVGDISEVYRSSSYPQKFVPQEKMTDKDKSP